MLKNNLHKLYKSADTNNMKFNANKFELVPYGKEQEIKFATTYKSYDNSNIDDKRQARDRGIMMIKPLLLFILELKSKSSFEAGHQPAGGRGASVNLHLHVQILPISCNVVVSILHVLGKNTDTAIVGYWWSGVEEHHALYC